MEQVAGVLGVDCRIPASLPHFIDVKHEPSRAILATDGGELEYFSMRVIRASAEGV